MKFLIVLASVLGVGLCQHLGGHMLAGGLHHQPSSTYAKYLAMAMAELPGLQATDHMVVTDVQTQVVAGINTYIDLKINNQPCKMVIFDQAWTGTHQVSADTCTVLLTSAGKRQLGGMPGGYSPVTNLSDPEIQKALDMVVDRVNMMVDSMYRLTESKVSVQQQVVAGMNYKISMVLSPSTCLNNQANQHLMAVDCPVDANSAATPTIATAIVWSKPWENFMQITSFSAKDKKIDDDNKPKPIDHLLGGDGHDQAVHGKTSDINIDTQGKPPKVILGGDSHDYQRHGYQNMMGGSMMGPGMMAGYRMGPGMMNGYGRGPGMMSNYYDDDKTDDAKDDNKDDWDKMFDYMKENGMGPGMNGADYKKMVDLMKKYGMGPDMMKEGWGKKMWQFMKESGMGPGMMGADYGQMFDFMKKYGMGPQMMEGGWDKMLDSMKDLGMGPQMMNGFLNNDKPKSAESNKIEGDNHDFKSHGKMLGGDDHDLLPHGKQTPDRDESPDCTQEMFLDFQRKYTKSYRAGNETTKRFRIFCDNIRMAGELQRTEQGTARYGVTKFSDLTKEEFKQYVGKRWRKVKNFNPGMMRADIPKGPVPESFDWRDHGAVTPVKNQGSCGSCWAFSTTGNIEGQWAIKKKKLISLSEQELVDCDKLDEGCNGGLPSNAYKEIERLGGLETEKEYGYKGEDEKCEFIKKDVKVYINSSVSISSDETEMAAWLAANGPISIGINAFAMQFYMGGISHPWKIFCNPKDLDHGVLIVGYGVQDSKPYWIVKNSWGKDWGEKGYYLVYRGAGVCGLNTACTSSVVD